ncbi:MAG TPA: deoxynucleoside kinase [Deinococcales bacterium]|nr:deoxynucleoside kinase [Deinococcales bacterium]
MYIVVEGPIGAGKTSLTRILAAEFGAEVNLEVVEENPFLADFYRDKERFSFPVQVFFLLSRFKQLASLAQGSLFASHVVSDYMFEKDFIFASMNLKDAEFALYQDLFAQLRPQLVPPDLVVYLRAGLGVLKERIAKRGRPFERDIDPDYLLTLNERYDDFFRSFQGPFLTLEAAEYDFVEKPDDRASVVNQVRSALAAAGVA